MKTYNDKIGTISLVVTITAIVVSIVTPEIRNAIFGNEKKDKETSENIQKQSGFNDNTERLPQIITKSPDASPNKTKNRGGEGLSYSSPNEESTRLSQMIPKDKEQQLTFNGKEDKESDTSVTEARTPIPIYTPKVTKEPMKDTYCYDANKSYQYTSCCFVNLTGEKLILEKYYGYWISPEQTNIFIDVQSKGCTERLLVDYYGKSDIRDFKFYFKTESGKQCKYPIIVKLEKCVETTIEITSSRLGL